MPPTEPATLVRKDKFRAYPQYYNKREIITGQLLPEQSIRKTSIVSMSVHAPIRMGILKASPRQVSTRTFPVMVCGIGNPISFKIVGATSPSFPGRIGPRNPSLMIR